MRCSQAEGLREWARTQTLPIIAVGDYNFDYDFRTGTGNEAFAAFLQRVCGSGFGRSRYTRRFRCATGTPRCRPSPLPPGISPTVRE